MSRLYLEFADCLMAGREAGGGGRRCLLPGWRKGASRGCTVKNGKLSQPAVPPASA